MKKVTMMGIWQYNVYTTKKGADDKKISDTNSVSAWSKVEVIAGIVCMHG